MPDYLTELETAARAATPGRLHVEPWNGYELKFQVMADPVRRTTEWGQAEKAELVVGRFSREEDARFIALCSHDRILALVAVARAAEIGHTQDSCQEMGIPSHRCALCEALKGIRIYGDAETAKTAARARGQGGVVVALYPSSSLPEAKPAMPEPVSLRPEVLAFAQAMEAQLRANDHKPGWRNDKPENLFVRLTEEASELDHEIAQKYVRETLFDPAEVLKEAADVANFAMMIADVCGALRPTPSAANSNSAKGEVRACVENALDHATLAKHFAKKSREDFVQHIATVIENLKDALAALGGGE